MKLKKAIRIAKDCGLTTFSEVKRNIEIHALNFFNYSEIDSELAELQLEMENLANDFDVRLDELLTWEIKEIENDI